MSPLRLLSLLRVICAAAFLAIRGIVSQAMQVSVPTPADSVGAVTDTAIGNKLPRAH